MNAVKAMTREAQLFLGGRANIVALLALVAMTLAGLVAGSLDVRQQRDAVAQLLVGDAEERALVLASSNDFGGAAYATFHLAYSMPETLAFAALGQRDISTYTLRVRALALEGQIYETDTGNPALALVGRLDFAFVIALLLPLFVILLLYDLVAAEREAGRHALLVATAGAAWRLWGSRAIVRAVALLACTLLPFYVFAAIHGVPITQALAVTGVVLAQVTIWTAITLAVAFRPWRSPTIATSLIGIWLVLCLIVPMLGKLVVERTLTGVEGAQVALIQRDHVNAAWDLPRAVTMERFFVNHPEWSDTAPVEQPFHWKWYFAFQQVGDEAAAEAAAQYREIVIRRHQMAGRVGLISPAVAVQVVMQRLASTDTLANLAFQSEIREFHERLRRFYYPLLFNDVEFDRRRLEDLPVFGEAPRYTN